MISYNSVTLLDSTFSVPAIFLFASFISFSSKRHFLVSSILSFQTWIQLHICLTQFLFRKQQAFSFYRWVFVSVDHRLLVCILLTLHYNFLAVYPQVVYTVSDVLVLIATSGKSHFAFWSSRKKEYVMSIVKDILFSDRKSFLRREIAILS